MQQINKFMYNFFGEKTWKKASSYLYGGKAAIKRLGHSNSCNLYLLFPFKNLSLLSFIASASQ
ncbi:hypothetical protein BpHYR1_040631 [Brachionus plicatilis]|uniref:Uncharacterized protein n=1 Tax=Brachionus plicatilis TaxID=10195 RepID=A0A3M7RZD4_BRAPC|nr:hypothetical protein BpHYR1_040631 [Brachionus plicatilis]